MEFILGDIFNEFDVIWVVLVLLIGVILIIGIATLIVKVLKRRKKFK